MGKVREEAYHTIKFVYVIFVVIIIFVFVIVIIIREIFERLAGEVVDSTRDDLQMSIKDEQGRRSKRGPDRTHFLLDVLADLIVDFQFLLEFVKFFFIDLLRLDRLLTRGNRRREKVEK
jgi:hypothetical protein